MKLARHALTGLLLLAAVFVFSACGPSTPSVAPVATPTPKATPTPSPSLDPSKISPTTGLEYSGKYQPVAVMVNNYKDCWPQTGLQAADVVYEFTIEKGITRFMAIYNDTLPEEVGSVRSSRVSSCDLWQEWQCIYCHWGGEGDMRGDENVQQTFDTPGFRIRVDGMVESPYMFRTKEGYAPINSRVNVKKVAELYARENYTPPVHTFDFDPKADLSSWQSMSSVGIPFGYPVEYRWDTASDAYLRFVKGKPAEDKATGEQITVKNLVIMFMPHRTLKDRERHVVIDNVGIGRAIFFRDGKYIEGTWEKQTKQSPAVYKDVNGDPIAFTPGNTWISIAQEDLDVAVK